MKKQTSLLSQFKPVSLKPQNSSTTPTKLSSSDPIKPEKTIEPSLKPLSLNIMKTLATPMVSAALPSVHEKRKSENFQLFNEQLTKKVKSEPESALQQESTSSELFTQNPTSTHIQINNNQVLEETSSESQITPQPTNIAQLEETKEAPVEQPNLSNGYSNSTEQQIQPEISQTPSKTLTISKETASIVAKLRADEQISSSKTQIVDSNKSKISSQTLSIIAQIKAKSFAEPKPNPESSLSAPTDSVPVTAQKQSSSGISSKLSESKYSVSLREKFGDLVKEERDFLLPVEYKKLLEIFAHLDNTINYYYQRQMPTFLPSLSTSLEDLIKNKFTQKQLAQIMNVYSEAYKVTWQKFEKMKNEYTLHIIFPVDENDSNNESRKMLPRYKLDERKAILKSRLIGVVKTYHAKFLENFSPAERNFDYDSIRCWHSRFNVNTCPALPEYKFPAIPNLELTSSVREFIKNHEIANKRAKEAMEQVLKQNESNQTLSEAPKPAAVTKNTSGISESLLNKIRQKENILKQQEMERKASLEKNYINAKREELRKIAESIRIYYAMRGVSNIYYANVVERIAENKQIIIGKNEVTLYLDLLLKMLPEWLSITVNSGNRILRMDGNYSMSTVLDTINSYELSK